MYFCDLVTVHFMVLLCQIVIAKEIGIFISSRDSSSTTGFSKVSLWTTVGIQRAIQKQKAARLLRGIHQPPLKTTFFKFSKFLSSSVTLSSNYSRTSG